MTMEQRLVRASNRVPLWVVAHVMQPIEFKQNSDQDEIGAIENEVAALFCAASLGRACYEDLD